MAKKKAPEKEEIVRLYNRSKREYTLKNGDKILAERALDVPKSIADFYVKEYPRDFILYDDLAAPGSTKTDLKRAQADNAKLQSENAALKRKIAELEAEKGPEKGNERDPKEDPNPEDADADSGEGKAGDGGE